MGLFTRGSLDFKAGMRAHEVKDYESALRHFEKAAEADHPEAIFYCITYYRDGKGCERDLEKALYYAKKNQRIGAKDAYKFTDSIQKELDKEKHEAELEKQREQAKELEHARIAKEACLNQIRVASNAHDSGDYETAVRILQPMVDCGVPEAQGFMGQLYHLGHGVEQNDVKAVQLYRKAAEKGVANAYLHLAVSYVSGWGVPKDLGEALRWAEKAEAANVRNADTLAEKIRYSLIVEENREIIAKSQQEFPDGKYKNSEIFLMISELSNSGYLEKAFGLALRLALKGDNFAKATCAMTYYYGLGVKEDNAKALYWYEQAGDLIFENDQLCCGKLYYFGDGVKQDLPKALYWFEKAAKNGSGEGMFNCGTMYLNGEGTNVDKAKGFSYTKSSAEKGYPKAQYKLAMMYIDGKIVPKDVAESAKWMKRAASQDEDQLVKQTALEILGGVV
ncbi:MAG: sel1 repeat family protein [Oscillospiraceae bacterium]|nr:sel1 repeat family protein [Oscillospiraceae bacterium]